MTRKYLFLDLETTGLESEYDQILEIAWILTDYEFNELDRDQAVVGYKVDLDGIHPNVETMHRVSGLYDEVMRDPQGAVRFPDVDKHTILAGSSVHFDRGFMAEDFFHGLINVHDRISHRHLDLSSIAMMLDFHGAPRKCQSEIPHRAMSDIEADLKYAREAKAWIEWLIHTGVQ